MCDKLKRLIDREFNTLDDEIQYCIDYQIDEFKTSKEYISLFDDCYNEVDVLKKEYIDHLSSQEDCQYILSKSINSKNKILDRALVETEKNSELTDFISYVVKLMLE